eukprot:CAMPEP_0119386188 /NCGR_PEP_ID=MMETSP1334-20130426/94865_1 /TAXON_ID=127549 /ORGANISM="Calcidiscus leptoporus, Strain RCC1130" /LENGTH=53 /DNA_ID=CAMNT_0007407633 /DNA_START=1058 /DNA_END=1219 /DNA_ORIENTATION=+
MPQRAARHLLTTLEPTPPSAPPSATHSPAFQDQMQSESCSTEHAVDGAAALWL